MNRVNFLSDEFLREQGRKVRIFREAVLIVVVILAMVGWSMAELRRTQKLSRQLTQKQQEATDVEAQMTQLQVLSKRQAELNRQMRIKGELGLPVEFSQVIATIGAQMPESLTISDMTMNAPRPQPKVNKAGDKKKASNKPEPKPAPRYMKIVLEGVSPSNLEVATFVDRLTTNPLFSSVKVPYSRSKTIGSIVGRMFKVELEVSLDRVYVPRQAADNDESGEEIAHAG